MVNAKYYETASTSYSEKTIGFFFSGHGVGLRLLSDVNALSAAK